VARARDNANYLFEVEPNELLDPKIRVGAECLAALWIVSVSGDEQTKDDKGRQLVD
jgi:hypothetical protein